MGRARFSLAEKNCGKLPSSRAAEHHEIKPDTHFPRFEHIKEFIILK